MKFKIHGPVFGLCLMFLAFSAMSLMAPSASWAQSEAAALGSGPEFDWSDYRGTAKGRLYLARLSSISISGPNFQVETVEPLSNDVQLFKEIIGTLYVDRLGLRVCAEEATVEGRHEFLPPSKEDRYPQLDIGPTRIGLDLDIIRYPFVKLGINLDYAFHGVKLKNLRVPVPPQTLGPALINADTEYRGDGPITIGLHAQAIPFRLKEVPAIIQARVRAPVPYLEQVANFVGLKQLAEIAKVKVLDWEISGGLRPAVWDTSFLGHSTFSMSIEAGYRTFTIKSPMDGLIESALPYKPSGLPKFDLRAQWQGVFFQGTVFY